MLCFVFACTFLFAVILGSGLKMNKNKGWACPQAAQTASPPRRLQSLFARCDKKSISASTISLSPLKNNY